jgi:hypothetical protein
VDVMETHVDMIGVCNLETFFFVFVLPQPQQLTKDFAAQGIEAVNSKSLF